MSYEKQTWNKYDDLKTEEENIENGRRDDAVHGYDVLICRLRKRRR